MSIYAASPRHSSRARRSEADTAPVNFDAADHPIIARHWLGLEPLRPVGQIAAVVVAELQRTTRHLGPGEMPCDPELRKQSAGTMV